MNKKRMGHRKCRNCGDKYMPKQGMQTWCSIDCGVAIASKALEKKKAKELSAFERKLKLEAKAERAAHRKRKAELKPISWHHKRAAEACNAYIRYRDRNLQCCSCDKVLAFEGKYDAGHWLPQGNNKHIAYDEHNISGQCTDCNLHKSGNQAHHRITLVRRWGEDVVKKLEAKPKQGDKTWTREELMDIARHYRIKLKDLKSNEL